MQKVIFTLGLPASGKSTWAKKYVEDNPSYIRINRDDLRNMRGQYWLPKQEDLITAWQTRMINTALEMGYNVVLDDTNLNPKHLKDRIDSIYEFVKTMNYYVNKLNPDSPDKIEVEISYQDFRETPLKTCIERDLKRPNSVGASVIRNMYFKYLMHNNDYKQPANGIRCCIVDLDGTLCLFDRTKNAYDRDFINDECNAGIKAVLEQYDGDIIIFSGRNGKYEAETLMWLDKNKIRYSDFHMRKDGDTRSDYIVKKEMFDSVIRNKYFVEFVFDDRPQIVDLWKSLGLTVFNVGDGVEF